jgi:ribosomal protein L7/L12
MKVVKVDGEQKTGVVDLRPWFVTVTAVRETSVLNHKPSFIPTIKALRDVGGLDLAEAKELVDGIREGTPCVFSVPDETAARTAKAELESVGMTVSVSQISPFLPFMGGGGAR